jgi:ATP-binding cassette subfamily B (MDR/TAP) protein 6
LLSPWAILIGFVCLRYLQGSGGLAAIRDVWFIFLSLCVGFVLKLLQSLWASVMQYSDRGGLIFFKGRVSLMPCVEMSQLSFDHILNLSFAWHTRRKTGEILRVLDRGAAINHTLEVGFHDF